MGLDWSTFFLELINFLILVWILKRFLYAPVKAAIEARRQRVEAVLSEAQATREEAERLRADYETREQAWARERDQARADLERELGAERARRLEAIQGEIQQQRDKAAVLDERRAREVERHTEEAALALAARFGSRLLARVADPALEARLVELVVEDLPKLSEVHRQVLADAARNGRGTVRVRSAYPLRDAQRAALESALGAAAGGEVRCELEQDPGLIAGLRIDAGPLVMRANLRDELRFFAESSG
jgi:F-type H+-transporting ATPase subunit b